MKNLRNTILISALISICLCVLSCGGNDGTAETTNTMLPIDVFTDAPEAEEVPETERTPDEMISDGKTVGPALLGLYADRLEVSDTGIVEARINGKNVNIEAASDGRTNIAVYDIFGHRADIGVEVSGGSTTLYVYRTEKFREVQMDYGLRPNGTTDNTSALQKAIDETKPGETLYFYPGTYVASLLVMREGITLELATTMKDAHTGYTKELADDVNNGRIAVIKGVRFMNNGNKERGDEGCSDFTIRGGLLDMLNTTRGAIIFGDAENVHLINVIFKNIKGNHAIQYTGCRNSSVENCMFAGYTVGDTFTREVLQVEPSTPGATGAVPNSPLQFDEGEFIFPENITIDHCYFGKSDTCGAPLMAIGHHSQAGDANVTGFKITNNVFDEVHYAAIRYNNLDTAEISGNIFNSTSECMNASFSEAKTPAFIILYNNTSTTSFTSVNDGKTVTYAAANEQFGIHGLKIVNNTFNIAAGSDKRVIYADGVDNAMGLEFKSGVRRSDAYNSPSYSYTGYCRITNLMENIEFGNNTINVTGQPKYTNFLFFFQRIQGLNFHDNSIMLSSGVSFSQNSGGIQGLVKKGCNDGDHPVKYIIKGNAQSGARRVTLGDGDLILTLTSSCNVTIDIEGNGRLCVNTEKDGNAQMPVIASDGWKFDGFYSSDGSRAPGSISTKTSMTVTARFVPAN